MLRRKNGPVRLEQWTDTLSRPLSADNVAYILRGKCNNDIYPKVFNKLSDCITNAFNAAAKALSRTDGTSEDKVFALRRLNAVYKKSLFFKKLKWIKTADKTALSDSLKSAVAATVAKLRPRSDAEPDILFECNALMRTANGEI